MYIKEETHILYRTISPVNAFNTQTAYFGDIFSHKHKGNFRRRNVEKKLANIPPFKILSIHNIQNIFS